jgi:hypothetical protein
MRQFHGLHKFVGTVRFEKNVGRPADLEGRERPQQCIPLDAIGAERFLERGGKIAHDTSFRSA